MLRLILLAVFAIAITGCTSVQVTNPGSNPGIFNERVLGEATESALKKSSLPQKTLKNKTVYVLASNPGRVYSRLVPMLAAKGINVTNQEKIADYTIRVSERHAGVNAVSKRDGWTALIVSMSSSSYSSQAKSELLIEVFKKGQPKAVHREVSTSETLYEDIRRNRVLWILYFPIPLEEYWAAE